MDTELTIPAPAHSGRTAVFGTLPRRAHAPSELPVLNLTRADPRPSLLRTVLRLMRWQAALGGFGVRLLRDRLRGRTLPRERGVRLREMFERMGGTAVKVGQQMSVRIDLLPFEICDELSKLQDHVPPFPTDLAVALVERAIGGPLEATFEAFDPLPIGSASIACVYQAVLLTGEKVAVKVQRPGIAERFATDLRVLDWLTTLPEVLALVKPEFFKYLRSELRQMLMEELDFEREARYQRLFRRSARKARLKWLSAPKVFTRLCNREVLVAEFVEGLSCREFLAAVESDDPRTQEIIRAHGLSRRKVAHRLLLTQFWSSYESLFFHADPHPSNIVVQHGSKLLFLDFGSCGSTSAFVRRNQQALLDSLVQDDVSGMVEAALHLIEPLPPIDVHALRTRIQTIYERQILALRDKKSEWWERTTMGLWMAMVEVTREFNLPINLDVIRQFRSSLLYDTLAFRIYPELKLPRLYRGYRRAVVGRAARRVLRRAVKAGPGERAQQAIVSAGSAMKELDGAIRRAQNVTDALPVSFMATIRKGAYAVSTVLKFLIAVASITALLALVKSGWEIVHGEPLHISWGDLFNLETRNPVIVTLVFLIAIRTFRQITLRLAERDSQSGRKLPGRNRT